MATKILNLVSVIFITLTFAITLIFLNSTFTESRAFKDAVAIKNEVWNERIENAKTPQERMQLVYIKQRINYSFSCLPDYENDIPSHTFWKDILDATGSIIHTVDIIEKSCLDEILASLYLKDDENKNHFVEIVNSAEYSL